MSQPGALKRRTTWLGHLLVLGLLCGVTAFIPDYYLMLSVEAILLAVFAMSLDLIMGYAGIASFGHAAYFGAGGYTLAVVLLHLSHSVWLALLGAALVSGLLALFVGFVSIRARGIYFAILTLAFAEVLYRIVFHTPWLGGSDGLVGLPVPDLDLGLIRVDLHRPLHFYFVALTFAYAAFLVTRRIVNSPFGRVLMGIRDNEDRVPFLGFDPKRYKIIAFVISGVLAGWSGALYSLFKSFADTEQLHFLMSGKVIVMTLLGGLGTLIGPMVGAVFLTFFETVLSSYFESYHIVTGVLFILVVLFFRKGLWGLVTSLRGGA
jgi:branched-chain amino acid transport system permease protein